MTGMNRSASLLALALMSGVVAAADAARVPDGVWRQQGYGTILQIRDAVPRTYDHTAVGCLANDDTTLDELGEVRLRADGGLTILYGINRYRFEPLGSLPADCSEPARGQDDPLHNFDSLWQTMHEHYAFFERRGIDWQAVRARYRPRIRPDTGDLELFTLLRDMLAELHDSHVAIEVPEALEDALAQSTPPPAGAGNFELTQQVQAAIVARYLDAPKQANAGIVRWGRIDGDIGYLQLNAMLMLADYGVKETASLREFYGAYFEIAETRRYQYRDEVAGAERLMKRVLDDLGDTDALIIDLRFNGGGKDGAALAFLRPLVTAPVRVFDKRARTPDGFGAPNRVVLEPASPNYSGRVFLLTSVRTASAAEILVMASLALPQVTRIGGRTEGIFSDTLDKQLPNGWQYTLSNELYTAADGRQFESVGIEPDHALDYPREPQAFLRARLEELAPAADGTPGKDAAIELARELVRARRER